MSYRLYYLDRRDADELATSRLLSFYRNSLNFPKILNSPIYLEHIPDLCGKYGAYIITDGPKYYKTLVRAFNKETINLACQKRTAKCRCKFKVTLKIENIFDRENPGFYDPSNLIVVPNGNMQSHSCQGFSNLFEARYKKGFGYMGIEN